MNVNEIRLALDTSKPDELRLHALALFITSHELAREVQRTNDIVLFYSALAFVDKLSAGVFALQFNEALVREYVDYVDPRFEYQLRERS